MSRRSRELAEAAWFETDCIRGEDVSGPVAHVSASCTYDRFFGFYGRSS